MLPAHAPHVASPVVVVIVNATGMCVLQLCHTERGLLPAFAAAAADAHGIWLRV